MYSVCWPNMSMVGPLPQLPLYKMLSQLTRDQYRMKIAHYMTEIYTFHYIRNYSSCISIQTPHLILTKLQQKENYSFYDINLETNYAIWGIWNSVIKHKNRVLGSFPGNLVTYDCTETAIEIFKKHRNRFLREKKWEYKCHLHILQSWSWIVYFIENCPDLASSVKSSRVPDWKMLSSVYNREFTFLALKLP